MTTLHRHISTRRSLLAIGTAIVAGCAVFFTVQNVIAGGEAPPEATARARTASDALPAKLQGTAQSLGLELDTSRNVAPNLYLIEGSHQFWGTDQMCLVNTTYGMSFGCNPKAAFFSDGAVRFGIAEQGKADAPTDLTLSGLARSDVATVRMVLPSGTIEAKPTSDGGFAVHADAAQLEAGRPTELDAIDAQGEIIETHELPQG
jgi:hypothetical protein